MLRMINVYFYPDVYCRNKNMYRMEGSVLIYVAFKKIFFLRESDIGRIAVAFFQRFQMALFDTLFLRTDPFEFDTLRRKSKICVTIIYSLCVSDKKFNN